MLLVFTVLSEGVARGNDEFTPLPFSLTTSAATLDTMVVYDALLFAAHMKRVRKIVTRQAMLSSYANTLERV